MNQYLFLQQQYPYYCDATHEYGIAPYTNSNFSAPIIIIIININIAFYIIIIIINIAFYIIIILLYYYYIYYIIIIIIMCCIVILKNNTNIIIDTALPPRNHCYIERYKSILNLPAHGVILCTLRHIQSNVKIQE